MTDIPETHEVERDTLLAIRALLRDELRRQDAYVQFTDDDVWLVDGHFDVDELIVAVVGPALLSERRKQIERDAKIAEEQAVHFLSPQYATGQPHSSFSERFACDEVARAIRAQQEPK